MKIEKSKPRKGVSELPPMAKDLTEKLQSCSDVELVEILQGICVWRYGKCELYHWVDTLDRFDGILEDATTNGDSESNQNQCIFMCPKLKNTQFKEKVVTILNFTSLLIEHSYARHIYNSTEHLFVLLGCPDLDIVLAVLNLFYVFSKRSNFISRLSAKKRSSLNAYLEYLGETWGGKQSGFGLAECCRDIDIKLFPATSTSVFFKYQPEKQDGQSLMPADSILLNNLHETSESVPDVLKRVTAVHKIPLQQQMQLLTRVRLAKNFPDFEQRCKCILARLQALSILVYSVGPAEVVDPLIYEGFVEELVEVLESKEPRLMEIKAAVLRTLTAIIHLERDPKLAAIVESTGAGTYHGFLPTLVRGSVASFTSQNPSNDEFPLLFNTALFSFLYHLATYETSGDALVTSGIMESLLQVLEWKAFEPMNITLVTRAVRVIDLVTGLDMSAFHSLGGWEKMLSRLEIEVDMCRDEAPVILASELKPATNTTTQEQESSGGGDESSLMEIDSTLELEEGLVSCMPERAALIKSILNFLKKAIPEPTFAENIRNFVDSSLPRSLKHIASNAEYYGPSIYLPATEVTTVFIFQEPSQLSALQDNGLPGVVINSIITKPIPATREVLSSLPNILSAMCLNTRGLESFIAAEPFDHLFSVLTSPDYLPAMRKKKGTDQAGDTATSLGVAMDELMRHQPALRISVISALIRLLKSLVLMGSMSGGRKRPDGRKVSTVDLLSDDHMSADSDDDYDDESEPGDSRDTAATDSSPEGLNEDSDKSTQLLTEYVHNVIHFVDAILTNNTTKDHVTEFVKQGGLQPLVQLFALPLLPLDFPSMHGFTALSNACRGILNLAKPADLLNESLSQLFTVLTALGPFINSCQSFKSVLLDEVGSLLNVPEAIKTPMGSPQLHKLATANTFLQHFIYIFRTCGAHYNLETREVVLKQFASELGKNVLDQLSKLYKALVWEGFILLAVAADEEEKKDSKQVEKMDTEPVTEQDVASSEEQVVSKLSPLGTDQSWLMVDSLKHLTPLLTLTSRVGRSLAEFMNLLIRISITPLVRNPHRSRFRDDSYVPPSEDAMKICEETTLLLVDSLQWKVPLPTASEQAMSSPIKDWLFAGMTFKMYAVDFCELLLFDEHKQVYHMVLHAFDKRSGLEAYTSSFHEALKVINEENEATSIYGSSVDFLEAWLNLAEKLLNTSAIISSSHPLPIPPPEQADNKRLVYNPLFNPLGFLVRAQKAILPCLKALWDSPKLPKLTLKVIELLLATLRHLYLSEKPMERKLEEYIAADNREDPASQHARIRAEMEALGRANRDRADPLLASSRNERSVEPPPPPRVDPHHLQQLCDMGFARPHAEEALIACANDLNTAMEWILTHPMTENTSTEQLSEEEALSRAIALSLENNSEVQEQSDAEKEEALKKEEKEERERREAEEKAKEYDAMRGMNESVLEDFSNLLLPGSVELGAAVPESVSRVCDLIVSMAKRNGEEWWHRGAQRVRNTVKQCVDSMAADVAAGRYVCPEKPMEPLACQLQLLAMIMEEMPVSCAKVVCEPELLKSCINLLEISQANIDTLCSTESFTKLDKLPPSPKWLAALLTFIDIWGKTIRIARWWRPSKEDCVVIWQWFENSRWCSYSQDLGQSLEKAYQNGDYCYSVRSTGRSRYENYRNIVMFDPMLQVNTETGTIRPVIRLEVPKKQKSKDEVKQDKPAPYELKVSEDGSSTPSNITETQAHVCLKHCVRLLTSPIDSNTLNATLRLCLRFTRPTSGAAVFTNCGGPQAILSLKSKSSFKGFSTLAINILRHCIEDEATMKRTMEYIVQSTLTTPSSIIKEVKPQGNGLRDYHYVLRRLAPIATRDEQLLTDVCVRLLRVTSKIPKPDTYFTQRPQPTFLESTGPNRFPEAPLLPLHKILIKMLIEHLCSDPFIAEAQFVGESEDSKSEEGNGDAKLVFPGTRRNRTLYRRQQRSGRYEEDDDDATVDGEDSQPSRQNSDVTISSTSPTNDPDSQPVTEPSTERPLLSMSATLKLLAEILDSYPQCGMMIVESSCSVKVNGPNPKDMSLLAFIFDYIIPCASHSNTKIQNISKLAKSFIHCIATANYKPDVITILVIEFKAAFLRALSLPESQSKHNRIRALTGLLALVTDYNVLTRGPVNPGQFARILIRKGLISDMTRAVHSLDLTSPLLPTTLNGILKPLEALTRIVNQVSTSAVVKKSGTVDLNVAIPEAISEPATVPTTNQALTRTVAASSPAVLAANTVQAPEQSTPGSEQTQPDSDVLEATHESLVPLEEEPAEGEPTSEEEEMDREQILDTVASLASSLGRAHAQRQIDDAAEEADASGDMDQSGEMVDDEIEADTDSESEEDPEILEDGCNSAGEEVEDEEFDESQLDSSHSVEEESDACSHGDDTEADTEDEEESTSEPESIEEQSGEEHEEDAGDYASIPPSPEMAANEEAIESESGQIAEDVLDLEYDFDEDLNETEEIDFLIDMPWARGSEEVTLVPSGRVAGGSSHIRSVHTRPGQHNSTDLDQTNSFSGQAIPIRHPLMLRTADHTSQLAQRVRSGAHIPFETPAPIGETTSDSSTQPESAMLQLLANISLAAGNNDGLSYGVGASGAQRIKQSQSSQEQAVEEELESSVIQSAMTRWEETSSVIDGPATVHCMHELRDVIKAQWAERFSKENPKEAADEETFPGRRRNRGTNTATAPIIGATTSAGVSVSSASVTATPRTSTQTTSILSSASVPLAPHTSDQATPASPRDPPATVDQLHSSLRQVADALAQTVEAVRSTRELLETHDEELVEATPGSSTTTAVDNVTTTTPSSAHPIMATFDGTQESAVASLAATNRDDPLYMFLSAVAGAPTPPSIQTPNISTSAQTNLSTDRPRLHVFAQMQQEQSSERTESEQSPIRTPVIQDARSLGSQSLSLSDVQSMEESQEASETNEAGATTEPLLSDNLAMTASTPPSNSQSLQSPSPSDTLAPLLLSSLQLPTTTASEGASSSVIHDHPNMTPTQQSQASNASPQAVSTVPGDMLTPTGPTASVASTATQEPSTSQATAETPESSIDPTFLAALPLSIRQEVLLQHRREQRSRRPPESQEGENLLPSSISPEFLAALPPSIQAEVIQQEQLERARQQSRSNPAEPLDNSSFFQNLPSDLRRTILSDLDDSSLGHLPDELANEARRLQQEREARRRQIQAQRDAFLERMMEEAHMRAEASGAGGGANVVGGMPHQFSHHSFEAAGLHYAIVNLNPYALIDMPTTYRPDRRALASQAAAKGEPSSKQMLDPESLACILVPLFLDHNRLHINRLHRIIKNLCQHGETRGWVLSSLLEIIRKLQIPLVSATCPMPPPLTGDNSSPQNQASHSPNWLNISINAALGASAQVFCVEHPGKSSVNSNITIHPLASTAICNHVLDLLVFLARQFQSGFLPHDLLPSKNPEPANIVSRFWNIILKLDSMTSKKGKTGMKTFEFALSRETCSEIELFESSILGQLISLFSQEIFKESISLTDKLLRVLSYASSAIPKTGLTRKKPITEPPSSEASLNPGPSMEEAVLGMISPHLIKIVVSVLISGRCSEDGLEDATSLLTNLSKCSIQTRESILLILLEGVKTIGQTLTSQVSALFENLVENMESLVEKRRHSDSSAHSSKDIAVSSGIVLPSVSAPEKHTDHSNDLHLPSMVPLTCKGSQQSFFLRMLKVVCQLRESAQSAIANQNKASSSATVTAAGSEDNSQSQKPMDVDQSTAPSTSKSQKFMLQPLSLQLELEELWSMLSDSLDALSKTKDSHAVLVLQPLVEAFFLVHADSNDELKHTKKRGSSLITRTGRLASYHTLSDTDVPDSPAPAPMDSISPAPGTPRAESETDLYAHLPPDIARFLKFAEKHRTVLNQILRQSTLPLSEGPFSVLVYHTKVLDFDIKRRYFRHELEQSDDGMRRDDIVVHIRRDHIFEDSFRELYRRSAEELKGNLYIQFEGEEGQDVGGLLREWYLIIAREMFNPNYALFQLTPGDHATYIPNPLSHVNPNHLNYFKFIGRVIAKAIYDNKLLDCYFTRSFYKHILGKPVHFSDIEAEDYAFYQGIVYLLEHNYDELGMDLNFTVEVQEFGKTEVKELKPDGKNIVVTEANKREYVQLACQMKMTGSIQTQIKSFLEGFYEVIPKNLIAIFNEQELELLISGLPSIDIDDLKANTEYHKYTESSLQIQWFWRALRSFDQADRARFLQFVTGTSKVPLQGFAALEGMNGLQKFQIHKDDRSTDRLPCAHTCFNQLDLPPYPTYDKLYEMLLLAVTECPEGFGLA